MGVLSKMDSARENDYINLLSDIEEVLMEGCEFNETVDVFDFRFKTTSRSEDLYKRLNEVVENFLMSEVIY